MQTEKNNLLIVPIGGLEQIGANCTMIGYNDQWIIVDLGIAFYDKFGIEILTPDISFPLSVKKNIKGIFVTHAHEDHIGAIPYLWPQLQCPIYLTGFPMVVLKQKLSEFSWKDKVEINMVHPKQRMNIGEFEVEYVSLAHSILGACGIYIRTPAGKIFHTGDWKIDKTPLLGDEVDEKRLIEIGKEGVDCLLCDSTNVLNEDQIGSETDVKEALTRVISKYGDKRVTVTCFSSNIARIDTIFNIAKKFGRRVAIIGRSMYKMINAVSDTAYFSDTFKATVNSILTDEEVANMPPEKVLLVCTGSQGESRSALYRLARGENKFIKLGKRDVVLFSSKVIPGNELNIRDMQNLLVRKEVEIVTTDMEDDIHVSGHPNKEAIAKMYDWLTPRSLIPIHGDARMLYAQRDFAETKGIPEIFIAESGDKIKVLDGKLEKLAHMSFAFNALDGNDLIPLNSLAIRERNLMSHNGYVSVSFALSKNNDLIGFPSIVVRGIHIDKNNIKKIENIVRKIIATEIVKNKDDIKLLKRECEISIKKLITRNFEKKPIVTVHTHSV
ncbi:MAG: ribonuclease J [Holosporales bacterium]|jgi:ribonuclease J|nr:ribonuclease J [Holosporales bacterium]